MSVDTSGGPPAMDYKEHRRTYAGFLTITRSVILFCALLLIFLAIFLL